MVDELAAKYEARYRSVLGRIANSLREHLEDHMQGQSRIDGITARAKRVDRFLKKATSIESGQPKYSEPLVQIQDQIGARIVVFYKQDVQSIDDLVTKYYTAIESQEVVPDSESEFGYFGHHSILLLPSDVIETDMDRSMIPRFFELQIKTLFQHAWSEADHDLGYKPGETPLTAEQKRRIAFTSAQAWGADLIFDQLFRERSLPAD